MASFNSVTLLGNLTRDVEMKHTAGGTSVANCGIAVSDKYKKGDEWVETVCFVDLTFWGRTAEIASEYLGKGSQVLIHGKLKLDTWEKDGKKNYKHSVTVEQMTMLGKRDSGGDGESRQEKPQQHRESSQAVADSSPF